MRATTPALTIVVVTLLLVWSTFRVRREFAPGITSFSSPIFVGLNDILVQIRVPRTGTSTFDKALDASTFAPTLALCTWGSCLCQSYDPRALSDSGHSERHGSPCTPRCLQDCFDAGRNLFIGNTPHMAVEDMDLPRLRAALRVRGGVVHTISWLREPVARAISEYLHVTNNIVNNCSTDGFGVRFAWDYALPCAPLSFWDYLQLAAVRERAVNRQTRFLGCYNCSEREALDSAKHRLKNLTWFGLTERYDDSLYVLGCTFVEADTLRSDIKQRRTLENLTQELRRQPRFVQAVRLCKRLNWMDSELYRSAEALFDARLSAARTSCKRNVALLSQNLELGVSGSNHISFGDDIDGQFWHGSRDCEALLNSYPAAHVGTFQWYQNLHGCAFDDFTRDALLYRQATYELKDMDLFVKLRQGLVARHLGERGYVAVLGAAQTMGIMARLPFTMHLEAYFQTPFLPIGFGGVGPSFFTRVLASDSEHGRALRHLLSGAELVILQVMSGRSVDGKHCHNACGNMYCIDATGAVILGETLTANNVTAFADARAAWIANYKSLLALLRQFATSKVGLLLTTKGSLDEDNRFPHFVKPDWVDELIPLVDFYVDASSRRPTSQRFALEHSVCSLNCPHVFTNETRDCSQEQMGCHCTHLTNDYYPTEQEHASIAAVTASRISSALTPVRAKIFHLAFTRQLQSYRVASLSVVSVCVQYPASLINLYVAPEMRLSVSGLLLFLRHSCSVRVLRLDVSNVFDGTPLEAFMRSTLSVGEMGPVWPSRVTDFLRLALLYKHGGAYLDTDVILFREVHGLRNGLLVKDELKGMLSSGATFFAAGHPVLVHAMKLMSNAYNMQDSTGTLLMTAAINDWARAFPYLVSSVRSLRELDAQCEGLAICIVKKQMVFARGRRAWADFFTEPVEESKFAALLQLHVGLQLTEVLSHNSTPALHPQSVLARLYAYFGVNNSLISACLTPECSTFSSNEQL